MNIFYSFFRILLLGLVIKVCSICTQHLAYVIYCIMSCCKSRNIVGFVKQSHTKLCTYRGICLMTPNNESFDWFNRIISIIYLISQQLIIQCDVCSVLFTYQTNRNVSRTKIYLSHMKTLIKHVFLLFSLHELLMIFEIYIIF